MKDRSFELLDRLAQHGVRRLSGVPCSTMTALISAAQTGALVPYSNAPNEGEALAFGAGVWLGGGLAAVLCQNSGLGNLYNCLTSLCLPYAIPTVILCGWRGEPGVADEPQHRIMGGITPALFTGLGIHPRILKAETRLDDLPLSIGDDGRTTNALLICSGALAGPGHDCPSPPLQRRGDIYRNLDRPVLDRGAALELLAALAPPTGGVVVSTGLLSRDYFARFDDSRLFCMAGSMGHAAAIALGAHAESGAAMLVIEGDGSILMRPQVLAFVGSEGPAAFCHVVIDNAVHESTGGQPSLSGSVDLASAAAAFGYRLAVDTTDPVTVAHYVQVGLGGGGPVLIRLRIKVGGEIPPRIAMPFDEMALRFRHYLQSAKMKSRAF